MTILIKQARIVDPSSPLNGQITDIFIENGIINKIGNNIPDKADKTIEINGLHVSPGWMDVFANFGDPGFEFKETLETGAAAAAAGGYTDVMVIPNTNPVIQSKANVEYIAQKTKQLPVTIHPIGAITRNTEGKELAEMYDMHASGAIAFSDGLNPVQSAGILLKGLQYIKAFDGVVIQIPDDKSVGMYGLMHEGIVSTRLGLPGKPMMAEELLVARDIKLSRYADANLHFTGVTSPKSIEYIRRAKDSGLRVTCSVTPFHLFFTDEDLLEYDTNLKVYPPLRTKKEVESIKSAVEDGTIDCIATHHMPHEFDSKVLEFENAKYGMIGLETSYQVLKTALPKISESKWVEMLSINPRRIFGLPQPKINIGEKASMTIFSPSGVTEIKESDFFSKSKNSAFIGETLNGQVLGIIHKDNLFLRN